MVADTLSLAGKVALITGSGRENGIGGAIAKLLAKSGASVVIHYVSNSSASRAHALADSLRKSNATAVVVQGDLSTEEGSAKIVSDALKALETDKIDILVNNAGAWHPVTTMGASSKIIHEEFATNVFGPIFMTKATIDHMLEGGRIISVGSVASKVGPVEAGIYAATKAALNSLTWTWAAEFGRSRGITVNVVAPGPIRTDMTEADPEDNFSKKEAAIRACSQTATPDDVADAVLLLTSEKSRWITGQFIDVSGGITGAV